MEVGATTEADDGVRLRVAPGDGLVARRPGALLFVDGPIESSGNIERLLETFLEGSDIDISVVAGACFVTWSQTTPGGPTHFTADGPTMSEIDATTGGVTAVSSPSAEPSPWSDLVHGVVAAAGFRLEFVGLAAIRKPSAARGADVTVEPPQFDELTDLDVTLTPAGPVTYPDDDTDRTSRRPGDVRCARGHANASTNRVCRVCGESLDATAGRPVPRASTAVAGLRLPDGSVIPIDRPIVVGRSPTAAAARLDGAPRLVAIDAPGTVSRTHVTIHVEGNDVTVTDCGARGRTAVLPAGDPAPVALSAWRPRAVSVGDTIKLGGPTTLMITDPDELRIPASLERTARPPERDETT